MTELATALSATRPLSLNAAVAILGVTQIVGYGTVHYAYAIIAQDFAFDFGIDPSAAFVALSVALLVSGLASPVIGRVIDRRGPPAIMTGGSVVVAALYAAMAAAPSFAILSVLIVALHIASIAVLYGAAFPALTIFGGERARRSITHLTLIAGFASTLFWPLTGWLIETTGWRWTFLSFAALHLAIALPLHLWMAMRSPAASSVPAAPEARPAAVSHRVAPEDKRFAFWAVALSFGLTAVLSTSLVVHLVPILERSNLGSAAYLVSMIVGPAMVLVRLTEAVLWRNLHPLTTTLIAALCFPVSVLFLLLGLPPLVAGVIFAVIYGCGHGLNVIVGGTLPLALFGPDGYAEQLGRLTAFRVLLSAAAPAAFALGLGTTGFAPTLVAGIATGIVAALPLLALRQRLAATATR